MINFFKSLFDKIFSIEIVEPEVKEEININQPPEISVIGSDILWGGQTFSNLTKIRMTPITGVVIVNGTRYKLKDEEFLYQDGEVFIAGKKVTKSTESKKGTTNDNNE